jgi:hypothetical protein
MRKFWTLVLGAALSITLAAPAGAQSNSDDYTPLNSRIKRDRQFPLDLPSKFDPARTTKLMRARSKDMLSQLTACLYNRSHEAALSLLERTDMGFMDFRRIDVDPNRAVRIYGFSDCLRRVANTHQMGVQLRFTPGALRQWLLQEAYLDRYRDGPSWVRPGNVIAERDLPLSRSLAAVRAPLDFSDCVVQADPYNADYFFRATAASEDESTALQALIPSLGPCLPQGQQMELNPAALRVWVGEALWHAANHNTPPAAAEGQQGGE